MPPTTGNALHAAKHFLVTTSHGLHKPMAYSTRSAMLRSSTRVTKTKSSSPSHNAEIYQKLKAIRRALPAFGWDTEPVVGSEGFGEFWGNFLSMGAVISCAEVGWMDTEGTERGVKFVTQLWYVSAHESHSRPSCMDQHPSSSSLFL